MAQRSKETKLAQKRAQNLRHYYANQGKIAERLRVKYYADLPTSRVKYYADLPTSRAKGRASMFKSRYGITEAERDAILKRQKGCCAICRRPNPTGKWSAWCLDHCHDTGAVRGVLCSKCNMALGLFEHNKSTLRAAEKYLARATVTKPKTA